MFASLRPVVLHKAVLCVLRVSAVAVLATPAFACTAQSSVDAVRRTAGLTVTRNALAVARDVLDQEEPTRRPRREEIEAAAGALFTERWRETAGDAYPEFPTAAHLRTFLATTPEDYEARLDQESLVAGMLLFYDRDGDGMPDEASWHPAQLTWRRHALMHALEWANPLRGIPAVPTLPGGGEETKKSEHWGG